MPSSLSHFITIVPLLAGAAILIAAALHDIAARSVPNWMALSVAVAGLLARVADETIFPALFAAIAVFMAAAFCWRRGWMGGGDVKLLGAAALLVPPYAVFAMLACIALAGGVLAFLYLAARLVAPQPASARPAAFLARVARAECWRIRRGGPLPYACAIAAGVLITLFRIGA